MILKMVTREGQLKLKKKTITGQLAWTTMPDYSLMQITILSRQLHQLKLKPKRKIFVAFQPSNSVKHYQLKA